MDDEAVLVHDDVHRRLFGRRRPGRPDRTPRPTRAGPVTGPPARWLVGPPLRSLRSRRELIDRVTAGAGVVAAGATPLRRDDTVIVPHVLWDAERGGGADRA